MSDLDLSLKKHLAHKPLPPVGREAGISDVGWAKPTRLSVFPFACPRYDRTSMVKHRAGCRISVGFAHPTLLKVTLDDENAKVWPFSLFHKRIYERRFRAALVVLLGAHMFELLDSAQKSRVDTEVNKMLTLSPIPPASHRRWAVWYVRAAYRAVAMSQLGIEPVVDSLSWKELIRPPSLMYRFQRFDVRPLQVWTDYYLFDRATVDAKVFLRKKGLDVPGEDPWHTGCVDRLDGSGSFWDASGLRKYWQRKR